MREIDVAYVRDALSYDQGTGVFVWRIRSDMPNNWNARFPGKTAGRVMPNGYRTIKIKDRSYLAHRIAWLYVNGQWPSGDIDHINGVRDDSRIENLRDVHSAVNTQNQRSAHRTNKSTGLLGVTIDKRWGKFTASISVDGKKRYIGVFSCPKDAHRAYIEAKRKFHEGCTI